MNLKEILKKHGKSYTPERETIFNALPKDQFDTQSFFLALAKKHAVSRTSVFRTVKLFESIGIVRRISYTNQKNLYEFHDPEHHHEHLTCSSCHAIVHLPHGEVCKELERISEKYHFRMHSHNVSISGICENCSKET